MGRVHRASCIISYCRAHIDFQTDIRRFFDPNVRLHTRGAAQPYGAEAWRYCRVVVMQSMRPFRTTILLPFLLLCPACAVR
eukprot:2255730-Pyramimonas_sp.AAC.1